MLFWRLFGLYVTELHLQLCIFTGTVVTTSKLVEMQTWEVQCSNSWILMVNLSLFQDLWRHLPVHVVFDRQQIVRHGLSSISSTFYEQLYRQRTKKLQSQTVAREKLHKNFRMKLIWKTCALNADEIDTWKVSSWRSGETVSNPRSKRMSWDLAFSGPSPIVGSSAL